MDNFEKDGASPPTAIDTPASYYYGDDATRLPPIPEDLEEHLRAKGVRRSALGQVADAVEDEFDHRRRTMGGVDQFWLVLSDVTDFNPVRSASSDCTSIETLRGIVTEEDVIEQHKELVDKFPRLRQKVDGLGRLWHGAVFVDDPDYDPRNHVFRCSLPAPAGKVELDDLIGDVLSRGWDLTRPLWDVTLIDNYHDGEQVVSVLVTRAHHTLSDGQGFVISQLYLTSYFDDFAKQVRTGLDKFRKAKRGLLPPSEYKPALKPLDPFAASAIFGPFIHLFLAILFWLTSVWQAILSSQIWSNYEAARTIIFFLLTFWRTEKLYPEFPSGYSHSSGSNTHKREYAGSRIFSLQDIKAIQQAFSGPRPGAAVAGVPRERRQNAVRGKGHVTLNDVICAVMADVVAGMVADKPEPSSVLGRVRRAVNRIFPPRLSFMIPVSIRKPGDLSMRNLSTMSIVNLPPPPVRALNTDATVRELHAHIHRCRYELALFKHSSWPKFWFRLIELCAQTPILFPLSWFRRVHDASNPFTRLFRAALIEPIITTLLESPVAVLTNIPGPTKPITTSNVEIATWHALPPQAGAGTLAIGVLSYAGGVSLAIAGDRIPGGEGVARELCARFEGRFALYVERAREVLERQD
ncbi:wax ester synthase-like acyl-CoA acyltransferase domain-containing protein [Epithele typhae]|uniref:wax ester synthase-like acyl-CoA acyltransferase domain-containing protein n=1 Tax=Epithele typhae TaxID=378194 RepID=UPI002007F34A|nr:wax ester synthase-like acyl-CoA acyltransferase domain-containing protein [Epithele typhae]KAH9926280.1 wax ester synthase-like acyl-CoA acyltransferase domain-containing protein [Epithele typhae]